MQQHIHTYTIMSIHGMDPSKHQRHMGHGDLCLRTPTVSVFGSFHLLPKAFLSGQAKNVKNIRKTKENDLQMMGDDGLYSSFHVLKGSNLGSSSQQYR